MRFPRPTIGQAFLGGAAVVACVIAGLLAAVFGGSRVTLLSASARLMAEASRRVSDAAWGHLAEAERTLAAFGSQVALGLVRAEDPADTARALRAELAGRRDVSAVSATHARVVGYASDGEDAGDPLLAPEGRWRVLVRRQGDTVDVVTTRAGNGADPTAHPTFTTPVRAENRGRALWSDLFLDEDGHRVVSVQKALWSPRGDVVVVRVTLRSDRLDDVVNVGMAEHLVFLADAHGHLVTRLSPEDRFVELDDEVRVSPVRVPAGLAEALAHPLWSSLGPGAPAETVRFGAPARLLTVAPFPEGRSVGWLVGILVPESVYLAPLEATMEPALTVAALAACAALLLGAIVVRATRRDVGGLVATSKRLRAFDFTPSSSPAFFEDVREAADSLERAKTALRALGKYAPLDLVRALYAAGTEPKLGGRMEDVTVMFSDVEGFTSIAETLTPDRLGDVLGRYLLVMTEAIHGSGGIVDKMIGDGVMALWNVPTPLALHPLWACESVLACLRATSTESAWRDLGLAPWRTRFGLHRTSASVGHFGAPNRLSYTALGDGVNLAARLEGLNKVYGTQVLVTEEIVAAAQPEMVFRLVDRVAVKGKAQAVDVYTLLGRRGEVSPGPVDGRYQEALALYRARRFDEAAAALAEHEGDGPSRTLRARCRAYGRVPPPPDWAGVFVATDK